jgi:PAS domain S-box-containing protein
MESVTDYAIFFTDTERRVVTWNAGAERILGWTEPEIVGQSAMRIWTPEDRESGQANAEFRQAATGRAVDERWHLKKGDARFWASGILTALRDETGKLRGFCKILRDLTERKCWEEDLKAAHDKQRRVAQTLQQALLLAPPPNAFPGITVHPLYQPASDDALVGGDFFDVFAVEEGRVALVVGDATGKGIEAATFTAETKYALRAFLHEDRHPAKALERLNVFLTDAERFDPRHQGGSFIALSLCVVDTRTGELSCACGGIEPPFVVRAAMHNVMATPAEPADSAAPNRDRETDSARGVLEVVELSECYGPLLGVVPNATYREQRVTLGEGDVLALSTDGLTEARRGGRRREFFGYEGLVVAVCEEIVRTPSLTEAGLAVAARARQFAGGAINDDVCLLLARRRT